MEIPTLGVLAIVLVVRVFCRKERLSRDTRTCVDATEKAEAVPKRHVQGGQSDGERAAVVCCRLLLFPLLPRSAFYTRPRRRG